MQQPHRVYAGIGSRRTPPDVLALMHRLAWELAATGWTLRSGAADGADSAFEDGATAVGGSVELYLPWRGFRQRTTARLHEPSAGAYEVAARFHPAWPRLRSAVRRLHARNAHQVMGASLDDPVAMLVCWTPDAAGGGGTGQAIRVARAHGISVFDMADPRGPRTAAALVEALRRSR
jgi:hypothetical protein